MSQTSCIYYPQWTDCYSMVDENCAYLFFDLGLYRMIPMPGKNDTLQILVEYKSPNENSLPNAKEIETLNAIGQSLNTAFNRNLGAVYVGYLASNGVCGFYFCATTANDAAPSISEAMQRFSEYEYSIHVVENDCWRVYTDCFFPTYQKSEIIQNGMVVARLENDGDSLAIPRPVSHGFRFRKQSDRENFATAIKLEGFIVSDGSKTEDLDNKACPFNLEISRTDRVDRKSLAEYTHLLWNLAYRHYGIYEGWYTQSLVPEM